MAVKVVSDGPIDPLRTKCKGCYYMLEYTPIDVEHLSGSGYDGGWSQERLTCPRCKHVNVLKST